MIPGIQEARLQEMMKVSQAKAELRAMGDPMDDNDDDDDDDNNVAVQEA
jgi:hypothetical protein